MKSNIGSVLMLSVYWSINLSCCFRVVPTAVRQVTNRIPVKEWILNAFACDVGIIVSLHFVAGVGEATFPPGARHCYCEDCKVRGGQSSRSGKGVEVSQRGERISQVKHLNVFSYMHPSKKYIIVYHP